MTIRRHRIALGALTLGVALFLAAGIGVVDDPGTSRSAGSGATGGVGVAATGSLDATVATLQTHLERVPGDWVSWASLGLAHVQQARVTADLSYQDRAERALERSLQVEPDDNYIAAAGMSSLAAARHDFPTALRWARRGLAINPDNPALWGALTDALTQLGRYAEAREATQEMVDRAPDTASLARVSYSWELRGEHRLAEHYMRRARAIAVLPTDVSSTECLLGTLDLGTGRPRAALVHFRAGLAAYESDIPCLEGRAHAHAALGHVAAAIRDYEGVLDLTLEPSVLLAYGEYLESLGRTAGAARQYRRFERVIAELEAAGVNAAVEHTEYLADHGTPAAALRAADEGIETDRFFDMQDAYAWALHVNGRDVEALAVSRQARRVGVRDARMLYHAGMIELSLGRRDAAREHLREALELNPHFSPLHAPIAREHLDRLT